MPDEAFDTVLLRELMQTRSLPESGEGWIRAVRCRQGLQGKELAARMRVSPARISVLEKDELRGAVTLKMMQKAAEALDCRLVYALVPNRLVRRAKPRIRLDAATMNRDSGQPAGETLQPPAPDVAEITPD